jgi:hypothetical protein
VLHHNRGALFCLQRRSYLLLSYRTEKIRGTCNMSVSASVRPTCAEPRRGKTALPAAAACRGQFSGWIEIGTILPILVMANVEMCSNCAFPISRSRHIDHAAEAWQSVTMLLDNLSLPECTTAALEQKYTFCFGLPRVLRFWTSHSPKHIDRTHASFFGRQT